MLTVPLEKNLSVPIYEQLYQAIKQKIETGVLPANGKMPSKRKMAEHLKMAGFIEYEKYGYIRPSPSGWDMGNYLLHRHEVLNEFLCLLNSSSDELEQVEKIEHFFDRDTISNLEKLTSRLTAESNSAH
jgi:Mn-dependent DtxR family transcriptional regulator